MQPPVALTQSSLLKQAESQAAGEIRVHFLLTQVVQPPVAPIQSLLLEQIELQQGGTPQDKFFNKQFAQEVALKIPELSKQVSILGLSM